MSQADQSNQRRVTIARRVGMSFFTLLSLWTIVALTIGVFRGVGEHRVATPDSSLDTHEISTEPEGNAEPVGATGEATTNTTR